MAEDGASLPAHVCSCGISFGSILDPPDDNASDHCLTFPLGPSDLHKDWESDLQNDWGPANIVNPSEDWLDKLGSDLGSHNLTYLPIAKAGLDTKAGLDATDGCFSDVGFKIIKAATVVLLEHLIGDKLKEDCEGCAIDHPSQLQHSCLFDPPNFYFDTHFDELSGKLFNKVNEGQVFQNLYGDIKSRRRPYLISKSVTSSGFLKWEARSPKVMSRTTRKNFSPYPRVFHVNPRSTDSRIMMAMSSRGFFMKKSCKK